MHNRRSRSTTAPRQHPLAACLAAAFALGSATALADNNHPRNARHPTAAPHAASLQQLVHDAADPAARWPRALDYRQFAPRTNGAVRLVSTCADSGAGSLRDAAAVAAEGDTIDLSTLSCSTITLTSGAIAIAQKDLTIQGPGRNALRVDGHGSGQVFAATAKYENGHGIGIKDLTIANGRGTTGGCVVAYGSLSLERVTVTGCQAGDGTVENAIGGGAAALGHLSLVDSTVTGNTATGTKNAYGGGVASMKYAYAIGDTHVDHNVCIGSSEKALGGGIFAKAVAASYGARIADNEVRSVDGVAYGGGIFASGMSSPTTNAVIAVFATISGNQAHSENAWSYGGGIQVGTNSSGYGSAQFMASTISGNRITSNCDTCWIMGGGASVFGQITAAYSTIRDNQAISRTTSDGRAVGGGLATFQDAGAATDGAIVLLNSTVSGNQAIGGNAGYGFGRGGGIEAELSPFVAIFSTVANNHASTQAGGVLESGSSYTSVMVSSIIANNVAPAGADIDTPSGGTIPINGDHNLVMAVGPDISLPAGTLTTDPKLLPLAGNGGPTATHALATCSPAIDAGVLPALANPAGGGDPSDQRLAPYLRTYGAAPDLGAFELQPDPDHVFGNGFDPSPCP